MCEYSCAYCFGICVRFFDALSAAHHSLAAMPERSRGRGAPCDGLWCVRRVCLCARVWYSTIIGCTATASVNSRLLALSRAADFVTYIRNLPVRSRFSEAALRAEDLADDSAVRGTNHPLPVVFKHLTS